MIKVLRLLRWRRRDRMLQDLERHLRQNMADLVASYNADSMFSSVELITKIKVYDEIIRYIRTL